MWCNHIWILNIGCEVENNLATGGHFDSADIDDFSTLHTVILRSKEAEPVLLCYIS
jgi:hypothetical protein